MWFAAEVTNEYDQNGTATTDGHSGYHFDYNILNLPHEVRAANNIDLVTGYTYDAAGNKLKKRIPGGTINYIDGIQYKPDNSIDFIQTEEGWPEKTAAGITIMNITFQIIWTMLGHRFIKILILINFRYYSGMTTMLLV